MNNEQRKFKRCEYCGEPTGRPRFCSAECYDLFYLNPDGPIAGAPAQEERPALSRRSLDR